MVARPSKVVDLGEQLVIELPPGVEVTKCLPGDSQGSNFVVLRGNLTEIEAALVGALAAVHQYRRRR